MVQGFWVSCCCYHFGAAGRNVGWAHQYWQTVTLSLQALSGHGHSLWQSGWNHEVIASSLFRDEVFLVLGGKYNAEDYVEGRCSARG